MIKKNGKIKASKVNITYDPYVLFQVEFFGSYDAIEEGTEIYSPSVKYHESIEKVYIQLFSQDGFIEIGMYTDCSNMYKGELKDLTLIGFESEKVIFDDSTYTFDIQKNDCLPIFDITECLAIFDKLGSSPIYEYLKKDVGNDLGLLVGKDFLSLRVHRKSDVAKKMRCHDVIFSFDSYDVLIKIDLINIPLESMQVIRSHFT